MQRLLSPRWVLVHLGVLALVAGFLALGWWQVGRAAQGNLLSFGYAIEWPVFAVFVIVVWIIEMRKAVRVAKAAAPGDGGEGAENAPAAAAVPAEAVPAEAGPAEAVPVESVRATRRRPRNEAAYDDANDPLLAAYNHYLAWLNANPHRTPAEYPGMNDSTTSTREN
jgi:hypothetical protein